MKIDFIRADRYHDSIISEWEVQRMAKRLWRLAPPDRCPQCESLVWDRRDWAKDLFTAGRSWICLGCGFELWETVDEFGARETGERWATCRCCGRVLQSGEAAQNGYGALCATGACRCHERAVLRDMRRGTRIRRNA